MADSKSFSTLFMLTVIFIGQASRHVTVATCPIKNTRQCVNYNMVQNADFHAFIGEEEFDEKCRAFKDVFECVYTHIQSCSMRQRFAFDFQKTVVDQVCFVRSTDYKESQRCFMQAGLEERVNQCLARIKPHNCSSTDLIGACVQNSVTSTDGCTFQDGNLMRSLADARYAPFRNMLKCDKISAPLRVTISPTTTATTTSTTTTTTPVTKPSTPTTSLSRNQESFSSESTTSRVSGFKNTSSNYGQLKTTSPMHGFPNLSNSTSPKQDKVVGLRALANYSNNTASILNYKFDSSFRLTYVISVVFITMFYLRLVV